MAIMRAELGLERTRAKKLKDFLKTFEFKAIIFAAAYFWVAKLIADTEDLLIALPPLVLWSVYGGLATLLFALMWINVCWSDERIRNAKMLLTFVSFSARFFLPFFIGLFCAQAYILVWTDERLTDLVKYVVLNPSFTEAFYTSISTLYAIVTALALVHVLEKFDGLKKNVEEEPHIIRQIRDMTAYFERHKIKYKGDYINSAIRSIKQCLYEYANNVGKLQDRNLCEGNTSVLRNLQLAISRLNPRDYNDQVALSKMIEQQAVLSTLRIKRINSLHDKVPGMLILMLWLVSGALILPFLSKPLYIVQEAQVEASAQTTQNDKVIACRPTVQPSAATPTAPKCVKNPDRWGQYYMIVLMGTLYSFLLLMLQDISNPLDGFWQINKKPFVKLARELSAELGGTTDTAKAD